MARLIESVIGHEQTKKQWLNAFKSNRLPHAVMLVGPSGVGRMGLALGWAQILLCDHSTGCGLCGSCLRVSNKQSEALLLIQPEKNQIRIEQAHKIIEFLNLRSLTKRRVVILDHAELMNAASANSLLKILEEPPNETYFILIAPSPSVVMSTIRSRTQVIRVQPLDLQELKSKKPYVAEWILKAAQGSFEKLQSLSEPDELEVREAALMYLKSWLANWQSKQAVSNENYLNLPFREMAKERNFCSRMFYFMSIFFRDACVIKMNRSDLVFNVDQNEFLQQLAVTLPIEFLFEAVERCSEIEFSILQNRDPLLLFEEFWIRSNELINEGSL